MTAKSRPRARIAALANQDVAAMPLWLLLVDAELANGDVDAAQQALAAAERVSMLTGSPRHQAEVLLARGKHAAALRCTIMSVTRS